MDDFYYEGGALRCEGVALSEEASSAPGPPLQPESRASPTTTASSGREAAVGTISP